MDFPMGHFLLPDNDLDHILVKFEENLTVRKTQNSGLFGKKLLTIL